MKTTSASGTIIKLMDEIKKSLYDGCIYISVFLDLVKAFDTVRHNEIIKSLEHYGVRVIVPNLLGVIWSRETIE